MLDDIIATFLSLFFAVTVDAPRISREINNNFRDQDEPFNANDTSQGEYPSLVQEDFPSSSEYVSLSGVMENERSFGESLCKSLKATLTIILAVIPLVILGVILVYFDLRTTDLCFQLLTKSNDTLSFDVLRIRLIGDGIEIVILNLWFPVVLVILFGWRKFKSQYSLTVFIALLAALLYTLYLSFLLLYHFYDRSLWYRVPGNVIFVTAILVESAIVVRKIRQRDPGISYSNCQIFTVISCPWLLFYVIALLYRYALVRWFITFESAFSRFIVAIMTPALSLLLSVICRHMALWRSSQIISPERSFGLVYFIHTAGVILYRLLQADFKNIWWFIGLSIVSGTSGVLKAATVGIREKIWSRIIPFWNKICCIRLRHLPGNTPRHRRLKADMNIQNILFDSNSLILIQAYIVLYQITSFEMSAWTVLKSSLIRIAIGISIEIVCNFISTFIHIHWRNIPIARAWSKAWKRHMFANSVIIVCLVTYFTKPLLVVFQHRFHDNPAFGSGVYTIRNCTLSF
ncbi:uncharacterized protein LOC114537687 [Dendronephthya gigantea]|uniref:uncharacterized protein LOC114537687 n=1 Tax=Dendronephthya gigantea TaxID=151771 RepID=UPI00106A570E|nr:uncharacterized protein LOC114537687 [Dendronephthya gigantea]